MLTLIVAERLFVQIAEEMERLDRHIGAFQAALQQRPEVLKPVRMNLAIDVALCVVNEAVNKVGFQAFVRQERIGKDLRAFCYVLANFLLQCVAFTMRDMLQANLAGLAIDFDIDRYRNRPPWQIGDSVGEARIDVGRDTAWWVERAYGKAGRGTTRASAGMSPP